MSAISSLVGFDDLESKIENAFKTSKLHHANLIYGKRGVGKALFAKKLVTKFLDLQINNFDDLIKLNSHPDFLLIQKQDKAQITVDQIRQIKIFNSQTSGSSKYKFIIIDAACELNQKSANALLKTLEEPNNNSFLFLVCHNLGAVLPTIKSRCQLISAPNFSLNQFQKIVNSKDNSFSDLDISFLSRICDNSPAKALEIGEDLIKNYNLLIDSLKEKAIKPELLKNITAKNFDFYIISLILNFVMINMVKISANASLADFGRDLDVMHKIISKKKDLGQFINDIEEAISLINQSSHLHMEKKLTVINVFNKLCY